MKETVVLATAGDKEPAVAEEEITAVDTALVAIVFAQNVAKRYHISRV
ncbi:MAG: hypothetical protein PHU97_03830 [Bacteroidales bacterium]|nr:hypothetical protein [Bacteroidales bacterium]MDD2322599.1 hypothetical protein [Bacteroidales bacterium]MDD3010430.1 hypothetical protein [Bacteroidales bacterium]MDD3961878.1 hypothetical protein [Bacteroidales bacterium]MDY0285504.1 hypothetical protein [Bacteroidales bacterium]